MRMTFAVRDAPRELQLLDEAPNHVLVERELRAQDLEHQLLAHDRVLDEVDGAEATAADAPDHAPAVHEQDPRLEALVVVPSGPASRTRAATARRRTPAAASRAWNPPPRVPTRGPGCRAPRTAAACRAPADTPADSSVVYSEARMSDGRSIFANFVSASIATRRTSAFSEFARRQIGSTAWTSPDLGEGPHAQRDRARITGQRAQQRVDGAVVTRLGERVDGPLAHPPVVVVECLDERLDGAGVRYHVEDLDGVAADEVVGIVEQRDHRLDDALAAERSEGVGRAHTHPPVDVAECRDQVLDRLHGDDVVEHLDRAAANVLGFVLQVLEQVGDGADVLDLDQGFDRRRLHLDVGVPQPRAQRRDRLRVLERRQRANGLQAHGRVLVAQQLGDNRARLLARELGQQLHHVEPEPPLGVHREPDRLADNGRVRALLEQAEHAAARVTAQIGEHLEQGPRLDRLHARGQDGFDARLRHAGVAEQRQQQRGVVALALRQRVGGGLDDGRVGARRAATKAGSVAFETKRSSTWNAGPRAGSPCSESRIERIASGPSDSSWFWASVIAVGVSPSDDWSCRA